MKLLHLISMINESQFLIERDVMNAPELKQWAKQSAARLTDPQSAIWYASQLFKFLINRYNDGVRPTTLGDLGDDVPEWVLAKVKAGDPIINVEPQQQLRQQAEQVIDWLNAMTAENESPNLRMTWEDAVEAQAEWHRDIARASRVTELTAEQMEGIVTIMEFDDGYRWVDVQTEVCLQHEGTVMGHCVGQGGYTAGVQEGTTKILSLRDGNNNPHATIEGDSEHPIMINKDMLNSGQADLFLDNALEQSFVDLAIRQIKGKENKPVVRKYREYVQDFLTKFGIENFEYGGERDLENCGLFQLKKGGYVNTEEIGEHIAKMGDGTVWHRVDTEYVHIHTYSNNITAKWYLFDKTGRSLGDMSEHPRTMINQIDFREATNQGYDSTNAQYGEHVIVAFDSKYDNNRAGIFPDQRLYQGFYNTLEGMGLGVNGKSIVGAPQTIGKLFTKTEAGDVYATVSSTEGDTYWLMHGDQIKARFMIESSSIDGHDGYTMSFDKNRGVPSGSIATFVKNIEEAFDGKVNIKYLQVKNQTLNLDDILWEPNQGVEKDELIMEQDGVKYYRHKAGDIKPITWYDAVDSHNQLIFNMTIEGQRFKTRWVSDAKVAGFYAVYLLDHLDETDDVDIGHFSNYSSFARELLEETKWFQGERSLTWYVEDETFPIHMVETHSYSDGSEDDVTDEDTTMKAYFDSTQMYDYGFEVDRFAMEYEHVYHGGHTGWDDEHDPDDDGGILHTRTDWSVEGIGNADTVTHPVSGGTVRVSK